MIHDFSDLPAALYEFALHQLQADGILQIDSSSGFLQEVSGADDLRRAALGRDRFAAWLWWLRFGVAFENLVKAVFLRHKISLLRKNDLLSKGGGGIREVRYPPAAKVYDAVRGTRVSAKKNPWMEAEFSRLNIEHPMEINSGTLGPYRESLSRLKGAGLSSAEEVLLSSAISLLSDMRRNVDAHVFLKSQVFGSINSDLRDVYIPACNVLMRLYK